MTLAPMTLTETPRSAAPLAAGLFGGAHDAARHPEALAEPLTQSPAKPLGGKPLGAKPQGENAAARRQSFSDLFRVDGGQLHAA